MQVFKGDPTELKMIAVGTELFDNLSLQKDEFFDDAYLSAILGEVLFDSERAPLTNAISREFFRTSFSELFDSFVAGGTFESYITVFKKIFGDDVVVTFTVPAAGKLNIDIAAAEVELSNFVARSIVDNAYVFDNIIEELSGDQIVFQTIRGFQSQYELEQMLYEMVPAGVYTVITLTLGA
jgi:hypothetical protein